MGEAYFHPRPSAVAYDPMAMAGTNLARTNPELQKQIDAQILAVKNKITRAIHLFQVIW